MLSDEVIEKVTQRLVNRMEQANEYILNMIGERIKEIGTLSPSSIRQIEQIIKYGGDYDKIIQKLADVTKLNVKDIYIIFDEVAKSDYQFAEQFYNYRNIKYIPYEENKILQDQVKTLAKITAKNYDHLFKTGAVGYGIKQENGDFIFKGLKEAYTELIDQAILNVSEGKETFDQALYGRLKSIGGNGLKIKYKDGSVRRADSVIRMNLQDGLKNLHNETQKEFGKEFKADGVEISVHANPAEDHAEAQGRQFSNEEYEKLQNIGTAKDYKGKIIDLTNINAKDPSFFRPISQYNCYHYVFSIVLGVSKPQYSDEELTNILKQNKKGFEFEGKHYTNYEGTQLQRRLETSIRDWKDTQILAKASDNKKLIAESQDKITKLTQKYKDLSEASKLPAMMERMRVSGYKRTKI